MAVAQLMERENVDAKIYAGTRPEAGDFGFTLAAGYAEIKEMADEDTDYRGFPLMNFNYYVSNNLEAVIGIQVYNLSEKFNGELLDAVGLEIDTEKESNFRVTPGVNYHFAPSNFLDTYLGVSAIVGTEKNEVVTADRTSLTGDYASEHFSKSTFVTGFDFRFGVRTFIADLPFALGAEFGINGVNHSNLQYETTTESSIGGVTTKQTFYTKEADAAAAKYKSLEYKKFEMGSNVRLVLTYYFRK
ncbi:hypothetical protein BFP72_15080 [Reichenbachiella sp. 5M10]|nr:hypothetical protein BFP72_15080 [Reichenbachiella sp. 5M10]